MLDNPPTPLPTQPGKLPLTGWQRLQRSLSPALVITRRELNDQFRDWRILVPTIFLTLVFPSIMNFTADRVTSFVARYNAPIVGERLIPFLLMVVGFFPLSVSLVIALESFVGEKERRSIEPLLCSPLSDGQLYLGKLLAALVPPLLASYLGIFVYLFGIYRKLGWTPSPMLLTQILLLTLVQAIVMVSGAVVVSSQTTSVRAANLLASFIIIPMTFVIQGESIVMFWAQYDVLWWIILAHLLISGLLIRTGIAYFNREEMLGRELDVLDLRGSWRLFRNSFVGGASGLGSWYRDVLRDVWRLRKAVGVMALAVLIGVLAGVQMAQQFVIPPNLLQMNKLDQGFVQGLEVVRFYSPFGVGYVWMHNLRAMALASVLGVFSFGVLAALVLMLPLALIAYIAANLAAAGQSWSLFLLALVAPHGVLEIPAILIGGAAILSLGATLSTPAEGKTLSQAFIISLARYCRVMLGVVIPLFLLAAVLEVYLTPNVAVWLLGK